VRDNIHAWDVTNFIAEFIAAPRIAEVYNLGGGKANSISMMEAFALIESISGKRMNWVYSEKAREGDHIVYYSDLRKMQTHYPNWRITKNLNAIFQEIHDSWHQREGATT
jgi:CDP-paratose 2-epimerase